VAAWRVLGEAVIESRFAAIRAGGNLQLIGRAHEMGLTLDRWRLARLGEGQIVTVIGEAGIGKSRLIEALQKVLSNEPFSLVRLQCSPYHNDSALYPVIQYLGRAARFVATDSPSARTEKLSSLFAHRVAATLSRLAYRGRPASSSGRLAFTANRRASSRVSRFGRRAIRRSDTSGIGGEAEARGLRSKRR
jgi:ABC-type dipeptide/oligopeptide/nickel transport system ATPase component